MLKAMDNEVTRLTRKEHIHEADLVRQLDYVERKIEYEEHRNRKITEQIDGEQSKIDKIHDKYKDRQINM